jgi:hypothetical protein
MARAAKARRDSAGGGGETVLLAYKDAGHFGVGPPPAKGKEVPWMITMFGGSKEGNVAARADGWPRTLAFLEKALVPPTDQETPK